MLRNMLCHDCHLLCNNPEVELEARDTETALVDSYTVDYPHKHTFASLKESARNGCQMCLFLQKTLETDSRFIADTPESFDRAKFGIKIEKKVDDGWGWSLLSLWDERDDGYGKLRFAVRLQAEFKICKKSPRNLPVSYLLLTTYQANLRCRSSTREIVTVKIHYPSIAYF